jgi:hypothetical protein
VTCDSRYSHRQHTTSRKRANTRLTRTESCEKDSRLKCPSAVCTWRALRVQRTSSVRPATQPELASWEVESPVCYRRLLAKCSSAVPLSTTTLSTDISPGNGAIGTGIEPLIDSRFDSRTRSLRLAMWTEARCLSGWHSLQLRGQSRRISGASCQHLRRGAWRVQVEAKW